MDNNFFSLYRANILLLFQYVIKISSLCLIVLFCHGQFFCSLASVVIIDKSSQDNYPFDIAKANIWQEIEEGVFFLRAAENIEGQVGDNSLKNQSVTVTFDVLKFDPAYFSFSVYSASIEQKESKTLLEWLTDCQLKAVINASMYLPDQKTSIGYLRKENVYNNKHIGKKLGAFFVASPYGEYEGKIPDCAIIYENDQNLKKYFLADEKENSLENALKKYRVVVQNFKLFEDEKSNLWQGQKRHPIAVIAEDDKGMILLMYASKNYTIQEFALAVQKSPFLHIRRAMYVEGGAEASMAYQDTHRYLWQHSDDIILFLKGTVKLPNVIGIRKR